MMSKSRERRLRRQTIYDDLNSRLRALARAEHDDLSIGDEAADRIEELEQQINEAGWIDRESAYIEENNQLRQRLREVVRCAASFIGDQPELEDLAKSIIRYAGYTRCERCGGQGWNKHYRGTGPEMDPCDCINGWRPKDEANT
jgi:ElaB/YqjD/DUF883 family membrane-anchored ribosome-binding protein